MWSKPDVFVPGGRTDWLVKWVERERKFVPMEVQAFLTFIFAKRRSGGNHVEPSRPWPRK